jgi:hypothetical protein
VSSEAAATLTGYDWPPRWTRTSRPGGATVQVGRPRASIQMEPRPGGPPFKFRSRRRSLHVAAEIMPVTVSRKRTGTEPQWASLSLDRCLVPGRGRAGT